MNAIKSIFEGPDDAHVTVTVRRLYRVLMRAEDALKLGVPTAQHLYEALVDDSVEKVGSLSTSPWSCGFSSARSLTPPPFFRVTHSLRPGRGDPAPRLFVPRGCGHD